MIQCFLFVVCDVTILDGCSDTKRYLKTSTCILYINELKKKIGRESKDSHLWGWNQKMKMFGISFLNNVFKD